MQPRRAISPAPSPAMRAAAAPSPCRAARPTGAPARSASRRSDRSRRTVGQRFDQPRALAGPTPLTTSVSPSPRSRASNLPRTLSAGVPYDMPSSTPRHTSAIRLTSSNVTAPRGAPPPESRSATVPENRASRPFARLFARRAKALRRTPAAATNAIANACAGRRMPPGVAGAPPAQGEDDGEATGSSMRGTTRARRRRCRARASRCPSARLPMRRPRRYGTARTPAIR
ncbi:hypothetical protein X897_175 [Burkholderia pseudomallei ABCPW 30]|nr:hypothetical protein BBJ_3218 [Burkholderia pseudomallei NCTC 13178]AIV51469.1 hypothetical protein Y603_2409 [Burkholderia pseudomallei MSHR1153]KGV61276.1 hypothetical protein X898_1938 [Burkholderia pseudomallei ABCPW 91]KGV90304.1 hypothetical protein X897_175 [Burkholderia pseudomallei ABCPW 30]